MENQQDKEQDKEQLGMKIIELEPRLTRYCRKVWPDFYEEIANKTIIKFCEKIDEFVYVNDAKLFNYIKSLARGKALNEYRLDESKYQPGSLNQMAEDYGFQPAQVVVEKTEEIDYREVMAKLKLGIAILKALINQGKPEQLFLLPEASDDQIRQQKTPRKQKNNINNAQQQMQLW